MFRKLRRLVFPPQIPLELADRYAEGHRTILTAVRRSKAIWDEDPVLQERTRAQHADFPDSDYEALVSILSEHQASIDAAMDALRRGRPVALHVEAFRDLSLGKAMDTYYYGWGGPEYVDIILDAMAQTVKAAGQITQL